MQDAKLPNTFLHQGDNKCLLQTGNFQIRKENAMSRCTRYMSWYQVHATHVHMCICGSLGVHNAQHNLAVFQRRCLVFAVLADSYRETVCERRLFGSNLLVLPSQTGKQAVQWRIAALCCWICACHQILMSSLVCCRYEKQISADIGGRDRQRSQCLVG